MVYMDFEKFFKNYYSKNFEKMDMNIKIPKDYYYTSLYTEMKYLYFHPTNYFEMSQNMLDIIIKFNFKFKI